METENIIHPEFNGVYFIKNHTVFQFLKGNGSIEVDFKIYQNWGDKLIFMEKGQYIKFLSDSFIVRKIELNEEIVKQSNEARVLFKHLVSLGYINLRDWKDWKDILDRPKKTILPGRFLTLSSRQWYVQDPFRATEAEYNIIFDLKDIIDKYYRHQQTNESIMKVYGRKGTDLMKLFRGKVGFTVKTLIGQKRLLESKKEIAFTDKSIKEIAYDAGYTDPAYFNRVFTKATGESPMKFRESIDYGNRDTFIPELFHLIDLYHKKQHSIYFYAHKMNMSGKVLSKKVKTKLNTTPGQLIRMKLTDSAKELLQSDVLVKDIAYELGFEEANHFSSFFKHYTSYTPSEFRIKTQH